VTVRPAIWGTCTNCDWSGPFHDFLFEPRPPCCDTELPWTPYVSIDIETTGLDPELCQIIEFGAVIDDWKSNLRALPTFHRYIRPRHLNEGMQRHVYGSPFALAMNADILRKIAADDTHDLIDEEDLGQHFVNWLIENDIDAAHINAAGKNFASFDLQFLKNCPLFMHNINFRHRSIDPSILYWRPGEDNALPDTKTCYKRAGLDPNVAHTAVADAMGVCQLVRIGVNRKLHAELSTELSTEPTGEKTNVS
jgi:DNA polymerase III epsilon subunit-like protein